MQTYVPQTPCMDTWRGKDPQRPGSVMCRAAVADTKHWRPESPCTSMSQPIETPAPVLRTALPNPAAPVQSFAAARPDTAQFPKLNAAVAVDVESLGRGVLLQRCQIVFGHHHGRCRRGSNAATCAAARAFHKCGVLKLLMY